MDNDSESLITHLLRLIILSIIIVVLPILFIMMPDLWFEIWIVIEPWLWLIISITAIIFIYKIIIYMLKRYVRKSEKIPKDATNGLILLVRIITVIAIIFVIMPALNISSEYLIDISTILATAIGIASTLAVSNLVAGIYMILTRPYKIGDLISVDNSIEGIVKEIGLNYTRLQDITGTIIQIPNNKLLSSNLTNYNIEHTKQTKESGSTEETFISVLSDVLIKEEIVNYVFKMEIALELDSERIIKILDQVCDRWKEKFGYRPHYLFNNIDWRGEIQWVLNVENVKTITNLKDEFLEDIWLSIYQSKEMK